MSLDEWIAQCEDRHAGLLAAAWITGSPTHRLEAERCAQRREKADKAKLG